MLERFLLSVAALTGVIAFGAVSGRIVDPQELPVRAKVLLTCGSSTAVTRSDEGGAFRFAVPPLDGCYLQTFAEGFQVAKVAVRKDQAILVRLALSPAGKQSVSVTASPPMIERGFATSPTYRTAEHLASVSPDPATWITYLRALHGRPTGAAEILIDGIPATRIPPVESISGLSITSDAFSIEQNDGSASLINVITRPPDRHFRIHLTGTPFPNRSSNSLDSAARSKSSSATGRVSGQLPELPVYLFARVHGSASREETPLFVPPEAASGSGPVPVLTRSIGGSGDGQYSGEGATRALFSVHFLDALTRNSGAGGVTLAEAGYLAHSANWDSNMSMLRRTRAGELRLSGGLGMRATELNANRAGEGLVVLDSIVAGGAPILHSTRQASDWRFRAVLENPTSRFGILAGYAVRGEDQSQDVMPNPSGVRQFESMAQRAVEPGTLFILTGDGAARIRTVNQAAFVQSSFAFGRHFALRAGLRGDTQLQLRTGLSPRVSLVAGGKRLVFRVAAGRFLTPIASDTLLEVVSSGDSHLRQLMFNSSSEQRVMVRRRGSDLNGSATWMGRSSLEALAGAANAAVEYSWSRHLQLLGSRRLLATEPLWIDLLESNRSRTSHRFQIRSSGIWRGVNLSANYEWARSMDDTSGPFSYLMDSDSRQKEWARSAGIPAHSVSGVGGVRLPYSIYATFIGGWQGSAPYNIVSGADPTRNGLFNDRGGLPRNHGNGPSQFSLNAYFTKRVRIPAVPGRRSAPPFFNVGLQVENVLGLRTIHTLGGVQSSANFGKAIAGAPSRSVRLTLSFD